jgi:hypothetical protein
MIGFVTFRKLWLPILALLSAVLLISSCSFGDDNVGAISSESSAQPAATPQIPESMKTGTVTGEGYDGPHQGL